MKNNSLHNSAHTKRRMLIKLLAGLVAAATLLPSAAASALTANDTRAQSNPVGHAVTSSEPAETSSLTTGDVSISTPFNTVLFQGSQATLKLKISNPSALRTGDKFVLDLPNGGWDYSTNTFGEDQQYFSIDDSSVPGQITFTVKQATNENALSVSLTGKPAKQQNGSEPASYAVSASFVSADNQTKFTIGVDNPTLRIARSTSVLLLSAIINPAKDQLYKQADLYVNNYSGVSNGIRQYVYNQNAMTNRIVIQNSSKDVHNVKVTVGAEDQNRFDPKSVIVYDTVTNDEVTGVKINPNDRNGFIVTFPQNFVIHAGNEHQYAIGFVQLTKNMNDIIKTKVHIDANYTTGDLSTISNDNVSDQRFIHTPSGHLIPILITRDAEMDAGDPFDLKSLIVKATSDGVDIKDQVKIESDPDLKTPGKYTVNFSLTNSDGETVRATSHLIVKATKRSIHATDHAMYAGDPAPTINDFNATATGKDGTPLTLTLHLDQARLDQPGRYPVTITSSDGQTITVHLTINERPVDPERHTPDNSTAPAHPGEDQRKSKNSLASTGAQISVGGLLAIVLFGIGGAILGMKFRRRKNER